jgi:hypothetical protein
MLVSRRNSHRPAQRNLRRPLTREDAVPLTWNEIRLRAAAFTAEWRGETREAAERQSFWNDWFHVFGITRRRHVTFERQASRLSTGRNGSIDAFWPGMLLIEHKSAGANLEATLDRQALDYLDGLFERELPRLVVVSDFENFLVLDLETNQSVRFTLEEFPERVDLFDFIAGYRRRNYDDPQDAVNVKAAELMGELFDELNESGYGGHELKLLLVRLLFILFADDTGIWQRGIFQEYVELKTSEDGRDLGPALDLLFQVLNQPETRRQRTLDEDLAQFPYINGGLFAERIATPAFNSAMRTSLVRCCGFDWSAISPAVFGSMFQSVMEPNERREVGAHYTTEQNILKLIGPLFLDELKAELDRLRQPRQYREFQQKLADLRFLDPACGSGNFLLITYRELRRLELEAMRRLRAADRGRSDQLVLDARELVKVGMDQFHGIESEEFPARIAEVGMYLVDHIENQRLALEFGVAPVEFPISTSADIRIGNALAMDWSQQVAPTRTAYVLGNPPFVGKQHRTATQRADMAAVFGGDRGAGVLDYVSAWFRTAATWLAGSEARVAFVSTNSIVQGEQVPALWPALLAEGIEIDFAHRTFDWSSEARGRAHVHVVIIGFSHRGQRPGKLLYDYEHVRAAPREFAATIINPYLVDAPSVVVGRRREPLVPSPPCRFGSMPNDGGHLIVDASQAADLITRDPVASRYLRQLVGAEQMMSGVRRYCLWLEDLSAADLRASPFLTDRVNAVRRYRQDSTRAATAALAATPRRFGEIRQPTARWLCLPRHTSERRLHVPLAFYSPVDIAHDSTLSIEGATDYHFGVLSSRMFNQWLRTVGGRIRSDLRISADLVYNTFPWPAEPSQQAYSRVADAGRAVLAARASLRDRTLADLYDPDTMPTDLARAHTALDREVQRLYTRRALPGELDRQQVLFARYSELAAG